jgi:hypothetical protein
MSIALQQGLEKVILPRFTLAQRTIQNPYDVQFYLIHGETESGPWLKVGLNDCEYILGFVPQVREHQIEEKNEEGNTN